MDGLMHFWSKLVNLCCEWANSQHGDAAVVFRFLFRHHVDGNDRVFDVLAEGDLRSGHR